MSLYQSWLRSVMIAGCVAACLFGILFLVIDPVIGIPAYVAAFLFLLFWISYPHHWLRRFRKR